MRRFIDPLGGKTVRTSAYLSKLRGSPSLNWRLSCGRRVACLASLIRRPLPPTFLFSSSCNAHMFHAQRRQVASESAAGDYYKLLGVKSDASQDEIKAAYKKLALEYHPDRNHSPGAEEMFKNISEAYNVVGNKVSRKEYDKRRGRSSFSTGSTTRGCGYQSEGPGYQSPPGYQHISKEEADKIFRELFGGMRVDQIFHDFEQMQRGAASSSQSRVFQEFGSGDRAFRPSFRSESSRIYVDGRGNRMEERTFTDSHGNSYTVHSTSEQFSANQEPGDFYSRNASNSRDGRFHMGNSSFKVGSQGATNDFGSAYFGVRTHGRHPMVALLILIAWSVVLGTLAFAMLAFFASHPFFTLAVLFLLLLRRMRLF